MLRAFVVNTGRLIEPFNEPAHQAAFAGITIGAHIDLIFARRNMQRIDIGPSDRIPEGEPAIVLADTCFVSDKCFGDFIDAALDEPVSTRLALARTPVVDFVRPVSSIVTEPLAQKIVQKGKFATDAENAATEQCVFDCFLTKGGQTLDELRANAKRIVVPKKELGIQLRMPVLGQQVTVVPITSTVAAHVEHWVHILWLNQLAFGIHWMEIARRHKYWCAWRAICGLGPGLVPRMMRSFVRKGRNVRIHPTAHVEASILGDNVVIGAKASVRNSILGDNVEVGDHATVLSSIMGPRSYITPRTFIVWSATYEDAVINNYKLQVSLVGRGGALSTWAGLVDAKLQGTIDVMHDGERRNTERSFLGSCIGHGAFVGAKVLVLPGRAVPNHAFIAMRPDELISDVPRDLPQGVPLVRDKGTLVPLS